MFSPPSPLFAAMKEDEEVVTVGKFEFNKKDLIGTGAFAAVYKGRHLEKQGFQVAIKAINKRKLAKSQSVLGKEIKILKELKHENIVALYDFKEVNNFAYLVMEYCNGGDLADYLHTMRTLSEDTIRIFLIQIAGAMKLLHSKGIIHRDLKPQNILLTCTEGRRYNPNNIRLKIADFGFARHLQYNMMAATICGSPMYMAPEVILSQHYDAKADLWSIGTIVYQCLTGRAPFQARNPDELRIYYRKNKILIPNIPRETSSDLRQLLLTLLQRNQNDRMDFEQFFHHPFLNASSAMKKSAPVPVPSYPSSGSGSSCSSSSTSHLASPLSLAEMPPIQSKTLVSPMPDSPGFFQESKESAGSSGKNSSSDPDDFVMVPAQFPGSQGDIAEAAAGRPVPDTLMYSGSLLTSTGLDNLAQSPSPTPPYNSSPSPSRLPQASSSRSGHSLPIPVPTQIQNYRRIEQHLQSSNQYTPPRSGIVRKSSSTSPNSFMKAGASPPFPVESTSAPTTRRLSFGGAKPYVPSRQVGTIPEKPGQNISTSPTGLDLRNRSPVYGMPATVQCSRGMGSRLHSAPNLSDVQPCRQKIKKQNSDPVMPQDVLPVPSQPPQAHGLQTARPLRSSPKLSEFMQRSPLPTILGSPTKSITPFEFPRGSSSQNLLTLLAHQGVMVPPTRNKTLPDLKNINHFTCQQAGLGLCPVEEMKEPFGRSLSTGRLTDLLLKAAFGTQVADVGSNDSLNAEKSMEIAAPLISYGGNLHSEAQACVSLSPAPVTFTVGSPPDGITPPQTTRTRMFSVGSSSSQSSAGSFTGRHLMVGTGCETYDAPSSLRCTFPDLGATNADGAFMFEVPELPEETLMEQEHTDILRNLRFTVAFAHSVMEIAVLKGTAVDTTSSMTSDYPMQESVVADQISLLSREWSYAEQLVLYLRTTELLSSGIQTAMEHIRTGKLCLSSTVKQVVKKLNELYKSSISSCHCLNVRLQRFFTDKQKLMDRINSITAEKLIFSYAIQMVQSAALDEMFHHREDCVHRYHRALLLMDGLLNFMTEDADIENIMKCKFCIERRLCALQSSICA